MKDFTANLAVCAFCEAWRSDGNDDGPTASRGNRNAANSAPRGHGRALWNSPRPSAEMGNLKKSGENPQSIIKIMIFWRIILNVLSAVLSYLFIFVVLIPHFLDRKLLLMNSCLPQMSQGDTTYDNNKQPNVACPQVLQQIHFFQNPRCSMYGICTYIWGHFWGLFVVEYSIHGASFRMSTYVKQVALHEPSAEVKEAKYLSCFRQIPTRVVVFFFWLVVEFQPSEKWSESQLG